MSLYLDGVVDPIAASGKRELKRIPIHFAKVVIDEVWVDTNRIRNWCWTNLHGRFAVSTTYKRGEGDRLSYKITAAFEDSGEAVMFTLQLPNIISSTDFNLL